MTVQSPAALDTILDGGSPSEVVFRADMTVDAALLTHPSARWVFAAYHLGGCSGCSSSSQETLTEVAAGYKISLESFLRDLNSLVTQTPAPGE